ncbi:hypothetical protein ADT71_08735 [Novosphingobium sp. ST904]|nr:hypothetical protein ADT71_08735 [Novosphingobium sp. ST904]
MQEPSPRSSFDAAAISDAEEILQGEILQEEILQEVRDELIVQLRPGSDHHAWVSDAVNVVEGKGGKCPLPARCVTGSDDWKKVHLKVIMPSKQSLMLVKLAIKRDD